MIMTQMRAWKLRPGSDEKTLSDALRSGCVRLDYEVPDPRLDMTLGDLIKAVKKSEPDRSHNGARVRASQLLTLFSKVGKGDLALVPRYKGRSMMIGEILSERPNLSGTVVEVQVRWIDSEVPIARFDQDLRYSFMAIHKFCEVSRNNAAQRLLRIAHGETDPGYLA